MFDFIGMINSYPDRNVKNFKNEDVEVDTSEVIDGAHPYETGVAHHQYNYGRWIIVQAYDTKEEAEREHEKWVKFMTSGELPESLQDCCNSKAQQFGDAIIGETFSRFVRQAKE